MIRSSGRFEESEPGVSSAKPPLILQVSTVPEFFWSFLRRTVLAIRGAGYRTAMTCSDGDLAGELRREGFKLHVLPFHRGLSLRGLIVTVARLLRLYRRVRPDVVHAHTSVAGLSALIAATLARVPVKVFTIHGFRWETQRGIGRWLVLLANRLTCRLADRVFVVSRSNLERALEKRICRSGKAMVLGHGSISGVDAEGEFDPSSFPEERREEVRSCLRIPTDAQVVGFVGRIVADKGVHELESAWRRVRADFPAAYLVLAGRIETGNPVTPEVLDALRSDERVRFAGFRRDVASLLSILDVLVLPSYREGFPVVPLEAAAMKVPVIGTRIRGTLDAVVDGYTGILVKPRDAAALAGALRKLLGDPDLRRKLGDSARARALLQFRPSTLAADLVAEYESLLRSRGIELPPRRQGRWGEAGELSSVPG